MILKTINIFINTAFFILCYCFTQDLAHKWSDVKQMVPMRDKVLQDEMIKQQNNERLRRQFAAKANVVGPWIENQLDAVASIGIQMKGSLEDQLNKLHQFDKAVLQYKPNMDELERYNQVIIIELPKGDGGSYMIVHWLWWA